MNSTKPLRFGIVGAGGILKQHLQGIDAVSGIELTAICDVRIEQAEAVAKERRAAAFTDYREMMDSGRVDAVAIATPHRTHVEVAVAAFERGLHVLTEKPLAADLRSARRMVRAAERAGTRFGVVFQYRAQPACMRLKQAVAGGELGAIRRVCWTITNWFRTQFYYDSGGWRGTWAGEGGGVLLNQCPHQLDIFQWVLGMPRSVHAFVHYGKHHRIEVEDEVTAYMEWANGAVGLFVTSTGEYPGVDRFEIIGDRGRLVLENGRLTMDRAAGSVSEAIRTVQRNSAGPVCERIELPVEAGRSSHADVYRNFLAAVRENAPLLAPGAEGLNSLELANAALLSGERGCTVDLPLDDDAYAAFLEAKCAAPAGAVLSPATDGGGPSGTAGTAP